jgi:hypothetical protein
VPSFALNRGPRLKCSHASRATFEAAAALRESARRVLGLSAAARANPPSRVISLRDIGFFVFGTTAWYRS